MIAVGTVLNTVLGCLVRWHLSGALNCGGNRWAERVAYSLGFSFPCLWRLSDQSPTSAVFCDAATEFGQLVGQAWPPLSYSRCLQTAERQIEHFYIDVLGEGLRAVDPFQNVMDLDRLHALVISRYICLCNLTLGGSLRTHCKPQLGSQPGTAIRETCLPTNSCLVVRESLPALAPSFPK